MQVKFGSKKHIENLLYYLDSNRNIGRRWDSIKWDQAQRTLGMIESILCVYMPDKFAPGRKFEYQTITSTKKTLFGKIKQESRKETYVEMLLRNLTIYYKTL